MPFDPFKDGGATELTDAAFDPFKDGGATELGEPQNYFADKGRRLGRAIPKAIGDTIASAGTAVQSGAELAAEALRWRAVRSGDMTEAEAAAKKQEFLDRANQTAPLQAAQAVRDVGQEITDVGPRRFARPDPARDGEIGSAVVSGAASLAPLLAAGAINPALAIAAGGGYMGETQRQDAAEKGASPTQQAAAFMTGAPVGAASEALLGVPQMLKSVAGAKLLPALLGKAEGGLDTAMAGLFTKMAPAILPVAQQAVKSAVREGVQEGIEQIAQNTLAKDVVGYDPTRDRTEGAGMAMLAGSIVGGGVGAAAQAGEGLAKPAAQRDLEAAQRRTGTAEAGQEPTKPAAQRDLEAAQRQAVPASQPPAATQSPSPASSTPQPEPGPPAPATAPNFVEDMLAKDAAASAAARAAAAKEDSARTGRQTELAEKKARFEQRLAVARKTLADPAAPFAAVDGALNSITSYAEDNALGLTQTQREQALQTQAALQQRHAQLAPAAQAQADTAAQARRTEAKLAEDAKAEKVRRERAALQHLETTGRDLTTGKIVDLTAVPDDELETLSSQPSALSSAGLTPQQIEAEQQRRGEAAERAAATSNEAGYTLRDLILGKKPALAAAGLTGPLRLKSPAALSLEGGTMAGEHRAIGERQGGFRIFSDTGLAEDSLQERLQSLGFMAPDVTRAYALYEQALGGQEIRPERGEEQQVDFARSGPSRSGSAAELNLRPATPYEITRQDSADLAAFSREVGPLTLQTFAEPDDLSEYPDRRPAGSPPAAEPTGARNLLQLIGQVFGKRVLLVQPRAEARWSAATKPDRANTILINTRKGEPLLALIGHEFGHNLRAQRPELYRAFSRLVLESNPVPPAYRTQKIAQLYPANRIDDEWVNDIIAGRFDEPAFYRDLAAAESRRAQQSGLAGDGALGQFIRAAQQWLATLGRRLRASLEPRAAADALAQIGRIRTRLAEITAEYQRTKPAADYADNPAFARASTDADLTGRRAAELASYQDTMDLGSTPLGVTLPNEIRNLAPRWQDKTLAFDSSLDKALYYAGGTPGELRTRIIESLAQQTQLSPGEIATLARDLRRKLAPLARPAAANGTVRVPAQMQSAVRQITAVNFAMGEAEFAKAFDEAAEAFYQSARESVSTDPERISAEDTAKRAGEILTPAQAAARLDEWKALAAKEGETGQHQGKTILSLFDSTGVWSRPWREAGFTVVQVDQQIVDGDGYEMDVMKINPQWLADNGLDMVHGVLAACPCTEFAGSGARWFKIKDADGRTKKAAKLVNHTLAIIEYLQPDGFWAIENPIGRLKQETEIPLERLQFQPHNYGDPYTKRTQIYGSFDGRLPQANVAPTGGSFSWNLSGNRENSKAERSKTFEGFAYAFFAANYQRDAMAEIDAKIRRDNANDEAYAARAGQPAPQGQQADIEFAEGAAPTLPQPWPQDLRDAQIMTSVAALRAHEMYREAKAGSADHAWFVVTTLSNAVKLKALHDQHPDALLAPVRARERQGKNALPPALASAMATAHPSWTIDQEIAQRAGMGHTDATALARLANPAQFDGAVQAGKSYILLDDVLTSGSTINALRAHIEAGGGRVVAVTALAASGNPQTGAGQNLAPRPDVLQKLDAKFGREQIKTFLQEQNIAESSHALTNSQARYLLTFATLDRAGTALTAARISRDRPTTQPNRSDDAGATGRIEKADTGEAGRVDFASQANEYVAANGTPAAKIPAARADIERILGVVQDDQLELVSYDGGSDLPRPDTNPAGRAPAAGADLYRAGEAFKAPNQPAVVRAAYGIDPEDPQRRGAERISSIIPALIADPKRSWDIRGAAIATARDVMTFVNVMRSPYVETAKIILLNRAGIVVHSEIVGIGSVSAAIMDASQLAGVLHRAPPTTEGYDVIFSHNHPGGNPQPSDADHTVTNKLRDLLATTKHNLRDHVVTNGDTYYSYAENNRLTTAAPLPVTTQPPGARGADADTRVEPGTAAPWEIVRRNDLYAARGAAATMELVKSLRQVDDTALHIVYLNIKNLVTALERVPNFTIDDTQFTQPALRPVLSRLFEGLGREGAKGFILIAPDNLSSRNSQNLMAAASNFARDGQFFFVDYVAQQFTQGSTAKQLGYDLSEDGARVDFATGPQETSAPVFYSRLTRTVEQSPQGKASGAQWKATIRNSKLGVNQDEFALVGVGDLEDGRTYTKTEVLDYLRANQVRVQDVTLGAPENAATPFVAPAPLTELPGEYKIANDATAAGEARYGVVLSNDYNGAFLGPTYSTEERAKAKFLEILNAELREDALAEWQGNNAPAMDAETQFARWQLPGAVEGSYREVLLTMPQKRQWLNGAPVTDEDLATRSGRESADRVATPAEGQLDWRDGHQQYARHANPIVRLRYNERTTADGKRMLFLEEVQPPQPGQFEKMPALFQKNWREIAFKWAMRKAADQGFDILGYTTGRQQAERYHLSQTLERVVLRKGTDGKTEYLSAFNHRGLRVIDKMVQPGEIADYVGKEMAQKLAEMPWKNRDEERLDGRVLPQDYKSVSGLDLNVGGEGLKKLYDVDFRNVVNGLAIVKKSGQKVGTAELEAIKNPPPAPGTNWDRTEARTEQPATTVHALAITPEMRAAAMQGQAQFATGPDADPKARLADVEQRLAALSQSQEDPAELALRSRALEAERDQLQRDRAAAARTAQAAVSLIDVRHPLSVVQPEPGDAWGMTPKMTDGELARERADITNHLHDNYAGLAPAMRAHLSARLNALAAEQLTRGTPLGNVTPIPKIDRQAALRSELARGRALRDEGDKTGNAAAQAEGVRLVKAATARLDEEFPGWDKAAPKTQPDATEPPLPPEPPTAEAAPAGEGDGEPSPFSGAEEETRPVRPGKWDEVYGHSSYQPSFLLKTWRKIRDVLTGIKGPIPELPSFPAARWNKTDTFIAEHGPQFYARVAEGERALKSANDYLQRTAEEQIGRIITPLLKAEGKFNADDYARLRERQEQARRLKAEGRPTPPGVLVEIAALNSKMESSPYVLFNRLVLALDLHWRGTNLKDDAGNAITLPAGINAAETTAELRRLGERIAASPHAALIQTAVEQHVAMVKQVAADLKSRELLAADHLANPYYFPHLTLETTRGGKVEQRELVPSRVRPGTEADFRGYLETPVGSTKAIEHDYVRAMYYHLVQVGAHNFKADAVRDYFRPYDVKATVERRAKELSKARGVPVSWEQAFNEEFAPRGYVKYGTDSRDAFPTLTVNRDLLARRLGVMLTSGDLHAQLRELNQTGVKLLPEDIRESLSQGERETWIVPARVAEALRGIADRLDKQDNAIEAGAKFTLGIWKGWKLFMPWNHVRYEYGNVVADLEKLLSSSPGTFKYLPGAAKELRAFWQGGTPSADLRAALKDGVINSITAQELDGLTRLKAFEAFETRAGKARDIVKRRGSSILYQPATAALGLGDFSTPELSALREAITRYAHYQANLDALRNNARPAYGGAYWKTIDAMTDSRPGADDAAERKAAAISKATFGDYGDLSVLGQTARDKFIPFYSWMEINFRYHANLFRNLRDMVREGETTKAGAAKTAALTAAGFTARAAGGIALRLALPYLAVALWNASGDRDELEKLLSEEDRRRFHIILGRDDQGKVMVVYGQTALMDVMKWVSGPKFAQAMGQWFAGKTDFPTAAATWRDAILPDLANNTIGSFGPFVKIPYALGAEKSTFPDVTDQRTIPAYDMRRHIIGQITDDFTADQIERTISKDYYGSKDLGAWAKQLIFQVRQRDPESWAFYAIKDKANDYLEKRTGTKRDSSLDAPDQQVLRNFRRAIYRGDADKAVEFYQRLLDYGYTAERFQASIRSQDPLSALPKENGLREQFVAGLTADDRALLDRAYVYYQRINASRSRERQLFPSKASGLGGQMRYQAQPRTDALRAQMERVDGMTDEEREQQAQRDERRSLQKTR